MTTIELIERLKLSHPDTVVEFEDAMNGYPRGWGIAGTRIEEKEGKEPLFIIEGD